MRLGWRNPRLWDLESGKEIVIPPETGPIVSSAIVLDGLTLVARDK